MREYFKKSNIICAIFICFLLILTLQSFFSFRNSNLASSESNLKLSVLEPDYWPTSGWKTSLPETQDMSSKKLQAMENYIDNQNLGPYIDSLLIIRNGYLVYESYPSAIYEEDDEHHIYSCTKVFTSALIGIALDEGYITGINNFVIDYFPSKTFANMDSRKEAITIKHLLTMTAGLEWVDQINFYQMAASSDGVQYVLDQPMESEPGEVWNYNSGASHLLSAILDQETPSGTLNYAEMKIFNPLNITNYSWNLDSQGIPIGGTLLHLTSRDMAKFGFLYLHNGNWNGTQLIPSSYVTESIASFKNVEFDLGYGRGYGYKWWTYRWAHAYTARGTNEQYIVVIPDLNLVVVSTGNTDFQFIRLLVNYILPSAGFYPNLNSIIIISLSIGSVALVVVIGFIYYRVRKKRIIENTSN